MMLSRWIAALAMLQFVGSTVATAGDIFSENFENSTPGQPPGQFNWITGTVPGVSEVVTVNAGANPAGTGNAARIIDGNQNEVMARTATLPTPSSFVLRFRYHANATADRAIYVMLFAESVAVPSPDVGLLSLELFQSATEPLGAGTVNQSGVSANNGGTWQRAASVSRSSSHYVETFVNQHDTADVAYQHQGISRTLGENSFDVWVNGVLAVGAPAGGWSLNPVTGTVGDAVPLRLAMQTQGPFAGADFTFDDFSIGTIPEPGALALLIPAAALLIRRRGSNRVTGSFRWRVPTEQREV